MRVRSRHKPTNAAAILQKQTVRMPPMRSTLLPNHVHIEIESIHQVRDADSESTPHAAEYFPRFNVSLNRQVVNRLGIKLQVGTCSFRQPWSTAAGNRFLRHANHRSCRGILLYTPAVATAAWRSLGFHGHVTKLACHPGHAVPDAPLQHNAATNTSPQ